MTRETDTSTGRRGELLKPISSQIRVDILRLLNQETASASDLAPRLKESVGNVSYHCKVLRDAGCIEEVGTERRRGTIATLYRATVPAHYSTKEWAELPQSVREGISQMMLRVLLSEIDGAEKQGVFDSRAERHLCWVPFSTDEEGMRAVRDALDEALEKIEEIKTDSAKRLTDSGEKGFPLIAALLSFERSTCAD